LETLLHAIGFTWLQAFPRGGRYGQVSVPPAPSYGLLPLDEGSGLLVRHGLVSSCHSGQWRLPGGVQSSLARILGGVLTVWVHTLPNLLCGANCFYQGMLIPC
jgi:hypothetical protein